MCTITHCKHRHACWKKLSFGDQGGTIAFLAWSRKVIPDVFLLKKKNEKNPVFVTYVEKYFYLSLLIMKSYLRKKGFGVLNTFRGEGPKMSFGNYQLSLES